ncbi:hypothetical protein Ddye_003808 [Dipteronia dyeriana]|uniref:Uncharacterized protein n=1 Tax=Dipteronia dyeriana TaxID=168575 RepID=A0AAD9XSZ9_9ROSI|nr:hypothetical protein Ddye_003808 [Dipteronia dyeriana]
MTKATEEMGSCDEAEDNRPNEDHEDGSSQRLKRDEAEDRNQIKKGMVADF